MFKLLRVGWRAFSQQLNMEQFKKTKLTKLSDRSLLIVNGPDSHKYFLPDQAPPGTNDQRCQVAQGAQAGRGVLPQDRPLHCLPPAQGQSHNGCLRFQAEDVQKGESRVRLGLAMDRRQQIGQEHAEGPFEETYVEEAGGVGGCRERRGGGSPHSHHLLGIRN